ncbi:DEAD/DEAH box helicase [Methanospirillum stamsii]|uniref:Helicase n=1 Tax=Methanospirillum stamsii TaxID=1277351 RepID=A0A2V2N4M2_9EURY|nr:helicase-related protein [Methanospirillum stamsii]PWR75052.1 helicase [Methanospirillum stamsii]
MENEKIIPGSWLYSSDDHQSIQIISLIQQGKYRVWIPSTDTVAIRENTSLSDIPSNYWVKERIIGISASEKLRDIIQKEPLISPFSSRILPLPHQLYALARAYASPRVRFLLADEVGLGKTIEAGLIMQELKVRGKISKILIVAPAGLIRQWRSELSEKFDEDFTIVIPGETAEASPEAWMRYNQIITSIDVIKPIEERKGWTPEECDQYNRARFLAVTSIDWDLVIIDEAHKTGGTSELVARYKLAKTLTEKTEHLLLLSATPHQGKTDAFLRLMGHLDPKRFRSAQEVEREVVSEYVIRTEKRNAIDAEGKQLFRKRHAQTIAVSLKESPLQHELYNAVTFYVKYWYDYAKREKRTGIGFLMVLMQRLVSSSTQAILETMRRRSLVVESSLVSCSYSPKDLEQMLETDTQELLEYLLQTSPSPLTEEYEQIQKILAIAERCTRTGPDIRAESLEAILREIISRESDSRVKFLIFTEFVATQMMLKEYLEKRGFSVICLNGSMDIEERQISLRLFSEKIQILISTEAGGEGLNLQFCHIVINYDLPWNPMRVEQRIGRVDRIGQNRDVEVYNLVYKDTVDERVWEVLNKKLWIILQELGFDKLSDILDSSEAEQNFDDLYINALLNPGELQQKIDRLLNIIKSRANQERGYWDVIISDQELSPEQAYDLMHHPLPYWLSQMVHNLVPLSGGKIGSDLFGYQVLWPDGSKNYNLVFDFDEAQDPHSQLATLKTPQIQKILSEIVRVTETCDIPIIQLEGIGSVKGTFGLYHLRNSSGNIQVLPIFLDYQNRLFQTTAFKIWEILGRGTFQISGMTQFKEAIYLNLMNSVEQFCSNNVDSTSEKYPVLLLAVGDTA